MAWLKNNYQFEFTDTLTTSWTSVRISNEKENGAVATFTNQYITVRSEDNSIVERMKWSATGGTLTLTMRWLDQSDTDTQDAWLKKEWREWSKAFVTYVASQHTDAQGNNTFSWTQTFENITVTNNSTLTNATVSGKYKWPVVSDVTARNVLYPTPVWGNEVFVQSLNAKQVYNAWTAQRETQAVGTPAPDASETVKGIAEIATQSEVEEWTNDTAIVTPKKLKTQQPEALVDKDTYILWEDCLVNDSLFPETAPTFVESTLVQNIWDVTANTRVSPTDFGTGVSWSTYNLSLNRTGSSSANLSVRLETIDGSGNATGTLVNANATATVTAASLTTSLVDTTIILWSQTTTWHWVTLNSNETSQFAYKWVKLNTNENIWVVSIEKVAWCTATKAYIYNNTYTLLWSALFVWNIATLNTKWLINWQDYYICAWSDWSSYTSVKQTWSASFPYNNTKLDYIRWFNKTVDSSDISNNNTSWNPQSFNTWWFITFSVTNSCKLSSFNSTSHTITWNCELRDNSWVLIETAVWNNFSGNTVLVKWTNYRIQYTKTSSWPNLSSTLALTAWKNITYVSDSNWANRYLWNYTINTLWHYDENTEINNIVNIVSVDSFTIPKWQKFAIVLNQVGNVVNGTNYYGVGYVARDTTTRGARTWNGSVWSATQTNRFYYTNSTLALPTVLSKTDADFTYKLPTDFPRIANEEKSAGQNVITSYYGLKWWFTWLSNTTYYLSNTPWLINATAGTNPYVIGNGIDATTLKIDWKNLNKSITVSASPFSYTNTTWWPIQVRVTGGTVNPIVINWVTVATATWIIDTLPAWATMTVTYTVLPTIVYSDL